MRGAANLSLTFTPSASSGTLYAYLYDVNWADNGSLISYFRIRTLMPCPASR